jgi:hypothetical protein
MPLDYVFWAIVGETARWCSTLRSHLRLLPRGLDVLLIFS